jgi:hypothetical protein
MVHSACCTPSECLFFLRTRPVFAPCFPFLASLLLFRMCYEKGALKDATRNVFLMRQ